MSLDFAKLEAAVARDTDAVSAATKLLQAVGKELQDLAKQVSDPADQQKINDLAASLDANTNALAQSITDNTPSAQPSNNPAPNAPTT